MKITCRECSKDYDVPVTNRQIAMWQTGGLIQNVMPELTADERELLISKTCGQCFDTMFAEDDG